MTSLFFVMLVLFVVTVGYLKFQKNTTEKKLKKIEELQTAVKQLPDNYFSYQSEYKRFKIKKQIQFEKGKSEIKPEYYSYLLDVGKSINRLIDSLNSNETYRSFDIKYLVVIEGMASKDLYPLNFELSYERALALYRLWKSNGIYFNPSYCEVQISGSGIEGIREYFGEDEFKNQQFLINIVPKIGQIAED